MALTFVLAEAALETVPKAIANHPSVIARARIEGKPPNQTLLDRTYHHSAMLGLPNAEKRGRPDIVHVTLLQTLSTPLNNDGGLDSYIHTIDDIVIRVNKRIRLPRNYDRFVGLMEQLFVNGRVPLDGEPLLSLRKMSLNELIQTIKPTVTVAFSSVGITTDLRDLCKDLAGERQPAVIVGGFAHGHFSKKTSQIVDKTVAICDKPLDAWVVASRIIYEYETELAG